MTCSLNILLLSLFLLLQAVTVIGDDVAALKKEIEQLKAGTVSCADYEALQQDLQHMREDMDKMRSHFHKKMLDLMKEVDDEKKIRLNMQVEMDRIKKLVFPDDDWLASVFVGDLQPDWQVFCQ